MTITTDPNDPGLQVINDRNMQETYLVLPEEEIAKGLVRPIRRGYIHVGAVGPTYELKDLTQEQNERYGEYAYVKYEEYPEGSGTVGVFWNRAQLARVNHGCGGKTIMGSVIAETYARDPKFYGATYCCHCMNHFPVGKKGEFIWENTNERVGT